MKRTLDVLDRFRITKAAIEKNLKDIKKPLHDLQVDIQELTGAIKLVSACVGEYIDYKSYIEDITTSLLQTVLGKQYRLELNIEYATDAVTVKGLNVVLWEGDVPTDPNRNQGGGAQNLISIAWRLCAVLLHPELRPFIILDEPLTNLSEDRWPVFLQWLDAMCQETGLQVIIITNVESAFLHSATTYTLHKIGGVTTIERTHN